MPYECPQCAYWHSQGANFCGACGAFFNDLPSPIHTGPVNIEPVQTCQGSVIEEPLNEPLFKICTIVATLCICIILVLASIYTVSNFNNLLKTLTPFGQSILILSLAAIAGSIIYAAISTIRGIRRDKSGEKGAFVRSGLPTVSIAIAITLVVSVAYIVATTIMGETIDASWMDKYTRNQMAAMLIEAGPEEELLFRILPIGVPMVIIATIKGRKNPLRYLMGGFGFSTAALILMAAAAVGFGIAHVGSWGWIKVPQAMIGGFVFGYLFVEYGAYAAILAHTANDVITVASYVNESLAVVSELALIIAGFVLIFAILKRLYVNRNKSLGSVEDDQCSTIREMWGRH